MIGSSPPARSPTIRSGVFQNTQVELATFRLSRSTTSAARRPADLVGQEQLQRAARESEPAGSVQSWRDEMGQVARHHRCGS